MSSEKMRNKKEKNTQFFLKFLSKCFFKLVQTSILKKNKSVVSVDVPPPPLALAFTVMSLDHLQRGPESHVFSPRIWSKNWKTGRNPASNQLRLVVYPIIYWVFIYLRWWFYRISSINSIIKYFMVAFWLGGSMELAPSFCQKDFVNRNNSFIPIRKGLCSLISREMGAGDCGLTYFAPFL